MPAAENARWKRPVREVRQVAITSPMQGIAVTLPAPMHKAPEDPCPLRIATRAIAAPGERDDEYKYGGLPVYRYHVGHPAPTLRDGVPSEV